MDVIFFANTSELREWFEENHKTAKELIAGFHKKSTGKPSISWSESVDQAICFGWIDGIRRTIDDNSYSIRFTPRKASSNWSNVNIKKVETLSNLGLMKAEGLEAFKKRKEEKSGIYSFENEEAVFTKDFEMKFKENIQAYNFFQSQVPSYKKPAIHWVMSAKQEETRQRRLEILINDSEQNLKIKPLRR